MDKVLINNAQGESGIVNVVRYFQNNGKEYIIYSLNEVDESGYTRLYVTKLSGIDGMYTGETLDDTEWNEIKNLVKVIVKANKEGSPVPVQDLNPKKINNIMLKDKKVFKLNAPLVNDLRNNKPNFGEETSTNTQAPQPNPFDVPTTSSFNTPVQPTFDTPNTPSFTEPAPFGTPSAPFSEPVKPTFDIPSTPAFTEQAPFGTASAPFSEPAQPTFDIPSTPSFTEPTPFGTPNAPFSEPVQPTFDVSNTPAFTEQAPFGTPNASFNEPVQPTFNVPNETPNMNQTNTTDYKTMYDDEVSKNKTMQEQIDKLNEEIQKYKGIIDNIKNVIEK